MVEVCQVVDQAKIALTLVQKWICKNEVTKRIQKFQKITISKEPHFKSIPTKFTQKMTIFCLKLNLEGILKFPFQTYRKKLVIALVNLTVKMEFKTQSLQLLFIYQFPNFLPNSIL